MDNVYFVVFFYYKSHTLEKLTCRYLAGLIKFTFLVYDTYSTDNVGFVLKLLCLAVTVFAAAAAALGMYDSRQQIFKWVIVVLTWHIY